MFASCAKRRRVYNVVILLGIACVLILCFQFFLFDAIAVYHDEQNSGWFDRGARPKYLEDEGLVGRNRLLQKNVPRAFDAEFQVTASKLPVVSCGEYDNCSKTIDLFDRNQQHLLDEKLHIGDAAEARGGKESALRFSTIKHRQKSAVTFDSVWQYLETRLLQDNKHSPGSSIQGGRNVTDVRGINKRWLAFYQPDITGHFTCLMSKEKISYSQLNDDYCDCSDSSDEPGTAACTDGRFYCSYQSIVHTNSLKWLPSDRVNDGLCDCCDGSDEWANRTLPRHIQHKDTEVRYSIYQAPCIDRCGDLRQEEAQLVELKMKGSLLKQDYIKAGQGQDNPDNLYGPDGVFYKLSQLCVKTQSGKYSYLICPFGPSQQTDAGHGPVSIGKSPQWLDRGPFKYRLVLNDGDSTNCPGMEPRKTVVEFVCGIEDHAVSISENEVCQYLVRFSSPAVC